VVPTNQRPGRKGPNMMIIGCDYHPGFQQISFVEPETGELQERRLGHREEAEEFYRDLPVRGAKVRLGMEAIGHARWFERDSGTDASDRAGGGKVSRSEALADASRSRLSDSAGFRTDHWNSGTVSVWQADRELSGAGAVRGVEPGSATAGTYYETG
jgi:hypothetical protein